MSKSKRERAAEAIFERGIAELAKVDERSFASFSKALLDAAALLDELAPAQGTEGQSDEFTRRKHERDERVREAQAALRAAKASRSEPGD